MQGSGFRVWGVAANLAARNDGPVREVLLEERAEALGGAVVGERDAVHFAPGRLRVGSRVYREMGDSLPNNQRQRRTCYALCHILHPMSAAHTSILRMDSNSTSYFRVYTGTSIIRKHPPH